MKSLEWACWEARLPTLCLYYHMQKGVSDWHLAIVVLVITAVGTLIPVVGWAIPLLRSVPSLELDLERGPDRDVRNHEFIIIVIIM